MKQRLGAIKSLSSNITPIMKRRIGRRLNMKSYPKYISASVTWKCDSRCSTCGIWRAPLDKTSDIDAEVYQENVLMDSIVKDLQTFEITGGEPMLYHDIYKLTRYALDVFNDTPTQVRLGTNAVNFDKLSEYIDTFKNDPLYFSLSIDGIEDKHDKIRGIEGNFENNLKIIEQIRGLQSKGSPIDFGASVTVSTMNMGHIPWLTDWLDNEKIPFQLTPVIFPEYAQNKFARKAKEDLDFNTDWQKQNIIDIFGRYDKETYRIFQEYWAGLKYPTPPCYAMREFIHLRPDGTARTCMFKDWEIGRWSDKPLSEVWFGDIAEDLRKNKVRNCTACNRHHPNLCDSLNNYHFHGTLQWRIFKRKILHGR